jgi:hypothetical protein
VSRAALKGGEDHGLQVTPERVAVDGHHACYLDRLNKIVKEISKDGQAIHVFFAVAFLGWQWIKAGKF